VLQLHNAVLCGIHLLRLGERGINCQDINAFIVERSRRLCVVHRQCTLYSAGQRFFNNLLGVNQVIIKS
jgi:hypothetical protein